MRFVMAIVLLTFPLHAALNMSTDFESGSARVLELDAAAQRVRIAPAGDPKRGMPNWWYVRIDRQACCQRFGSRSPTLNQRLPFRIFA